MTATDLKCSNPPTLPCVWDPARCVTHRRSEPFVAPWRRRQLEQANGNRWVAVNDLTALVRER
jgi:hypothetical protein